MVCGSGENCSWRDFPGENFQEKYFDLLLMMPSSTYLNPEFLRLSGHFRTAGGRLSDGRRRRSCRQRRRKKKHLIEAAPFGRLDQMLSTIALGDPSLDVGSTPPQPSLRSDHKNQRKFEMFFDIDFHNVFCGFEPPFWKVFWTQNRCLRKVLAA